MARKRRRKGRSQQRNKIAVVWAPVPDPNPDALRKAFDFIFQKIEEDLSRHDPQRDL
jgi:hypothetical protein